ncbi:helix-turn-helix domain-containing protein [Lactobacillus sp. MRS-253-APC-2B]|uniref:helix-turn-helix domain-containing protein n=1 Tax=Lactobacillus sp. MRS-253-APC-2B TaxID=2725305 RepID=UPI00146F62A9|nr:helix-turn-helix domain-containing protein [Lactobacillus sp. MRS-253-APC-2B]NME34618.1 helix-turn-helix domain-containing protein [Lactobacillus sp. MRS-253-APC-2B]
MESENIKRSNWDAILPAKVRYDSRLKGEAKVLYSEILLLSSQKGYCYATDKYLAESYSSSQRSINRHIASLKKFGYIKIETKRQGKRITERHIYPLELPKMTIADNGKGTAKVGNTLVGIDKIGNRGIDKIGVVNDSNSNESNINKEIEKEGQSTSDCPTPFIEFKNLYWYENKLGSLDGKLKLLLDKYLTSLPVNVIQYAIDKAAKKDKLKSSYGYLNKVLADYQTNNIQTLDDLERLNAERYKQNGINDLNESSNGKQQSETKSISEWQKEQQAISQHDIDENRKYGLPEWFDAKMRESELATEKERESNSLDDTKIESKQPDDKANNDNQQDKTKVKDGQPVIIQKTPAERPKMTQNEQINIINGIAALQNGERLTKYQIELIERFDNSEKDLELLRAYKHQAGIKVR